jgi:hypothetical protein
MYKALLILIAFLALTLQAPSASAQVATPAGSQPSSQGSLFSGEKIGPDYSPADAGPPAGLINSPSAVEFKSTVKPLPADFKPSADLFAVATDGGSAAKFLIEPGTAADAARQILFANYEVVVIIDKSTSMLVDDCPGGKTRWDWCRDQTASLARTAQQSGSRGVTVVLFSDDFVTYRGCGLDSVPQIFRTNRPDGGTNTAGALSSVLEDYFMHTWHRSERPLLVAVITDGIPNEPERVKSVIADATRRITDPDEVRITFLQVGEAPEGYAFARDVDHNMISQGARCDIVYSKTFDQLKSCGVTGALLDAITRKRDSDSIVSPWGH